MKAEKIWLAVYPAGIKSQVLKSWKELSGMQTAMLGRYSVRGRSLRETAQNAIIQTKVGSVHTDPHPHCGFEVWVVTGDYTPERAGIFTPLMMIDHGLHLDGNHVEIELGEVKWVGRTTAF